MKERIKYDKYVMYIILFALACMSIHLFLMFRNVPVNRDAGYYVPMAKAVLNGATPTVDIESAYTPFAYYVFALCIKIWGAQYEYLVFLMNMVTLLNSVLLYVILSKYGIHHILKAILSLSYYCTVIRLGGHFICLEPFQVLFALLAFIAYLSNMTALARCCLVGLFLGISMMFKQYSIVFLPAFCVMVCYESVGVKSCLRRTYKLIVIVTAASVPFLLFVLLTKAKLLDSFVCFASYGGNAASYAKGENASFLRLAYNAIIKCYYYNWLIISALLYLVHYLLHKKRHPHDMGIVTIVLFSCLPLMIRQFSHYYMLIAPWSYMLWAFLLSDAVAELRLWSRLRACLTYSTAFCLFVMLPFFCVIGPWLEGIDFIKTLALPEQSPGIMTSSVFILMNMVILWLATKLSEGKKLCRFSIATVLLGLGLGLYSIFSSISHVAESDWKQRRASQLYQAREINRVIQRGSTVYVVDAPELYVTCDFRDPFNEYRFYYEHDIKPHTDDKEWRNVTKLLQRKKDPLIKGEMLKGLGFYEVHRDNGLDYTLYAKSENNLTSSSGLSEKDIDNWTL